MDIKLCCFFAITTFTLAACITPRLPANPDMAKWAKQHGYLPYTFRGQNVYCHEPVGYSGTFCLPSGTLSHFMAKNEAPPIPKDLPNVPQGAFY
jgi:hypothetical protein